MSTSRNHTMKLPSLGCHHWTVITESVSLYHNMLPSLNQFHNTIPPLHSLISQYQKILLSLNQYQSNTTLHWLNKYHYTMTLTSVNQYHNTKETPSLYQYHHYTRIAAAITEAMSFVKILCHPVMSAVFYYSTLRGLMREAWIASILGYNEFDF